ncbi:MAG: histidinol dehydrogenase [Candidatus Aenigmarchaeota archaeon]|nr:histidinol dehydrogenase [Candidatus Aenigmarchaeota archaeon]
MKRKSLQQEALVSSICREVKKKGDKALLKFTETFDKVKLENLEITDKEIEAAYGQVGKETLAALTLAKRNVEKLSKRQMRQFGDFELQIVKGVTITQKTIPVARVGIYVPGGNFPLPSTVIMAAVPATVAGVEKIILCSPPSYKGSISPVILVAADLCGVQKIFRVGGAHAIAAMAYGTETIPKVDKIAGPGNRFVTAAKKFVYGDVGIDMLAGPSEILVIADESADSGAVAADLLSEAEHDEDAVPVLITNSKTVARETGKEVTKQLKRLKTSRTARSAVQSNLKIILVKTAGEAVRLANELASEHIELQVKDPRKYRGLRNYGTLFAGYYSANMLGDYVTGSNHILPTGGSARFSSVLSVKDFILIRAGQYVTRKGFDTVSKQAIQLAEVEGLDAHKKSAVMRLMKQ